MDPTSSIAVRPRTGLTTAALTAVFATTVLTSAFLLFVIQPMFTKIVLPQLGGSASVWSIAMVFFQAMLLAGYGYAHLLTSRFGLKAAVLLQIATLVVCAMALPIGIPGNWGAPPESGTAFWLIGLFLVSVGLPFFAVSVNGPLLQAWFARATGGRDPYFLYGASNIGSFVALIGYPLVIETGLGVTDQAMAWSVGFYVLTALVGTCGLAAVLAAPASAAGQEIAADAGPAPTFARRLHWVALAFVPSALLVAVTAHVSTDVAAAPFLWVAPLALFLLTFVITFQPRPWLSHGRMLAVQPIAAVVLLFAMTAGLALPLPVAVAVHLGAFFVSAMVCHGELVRLRPAAARLTEFYLLMSLGGVLGGIFSGLLAPALFSFVLEYPLMIVAALLCRPGLWGTDASARRRDLMVVGAAAAIVALPALAGLRPAALEGLPFVLGIGAITVLAYFERRREWRFAGLVAIALAAGHQYDPQLGGSETLRSFYGVHKITETPDGRYRILVHGTTTHGAMRLTDETGAQVVGRPEPLTYYWHGAAMPRAVAAMRERRGGTLAGVGVIGLGAGSLACQAKPGENWVFYEIDPVVADFAADPDVFRFMSDCAPDAPVVLGDARLTLADETGPRHDVLVVDAFSSDSIPVHLLTREALQLYRDRTAEDGLVVYHVSNRHMELVGEVAAVAAAEGLQARVAVFDPPVEEPLMSRSLVVAVGRHDADFGPLADDTAWKRVQPAPGMAAWTDDRSTILGALWRHYVGVDGFVVRP